MGLATFGALLSVGVVAGLLPVELVESASHALRTLGLFGGAAASVETGRPPQIWSLSVPASLAVAVTAAAYVGYLILDLIRKRPGVIAEGVGAIWLAAFIATLPAILIGSIAIEPIGGDAFLTAILCAAPAGFAAFYACRIRRDNLWFLHVADPASRALTVENKKLIKGFIYGCLVTAFVAYALLR